MFMNENHNGDFFVLLSDWVVVGLVVNNYT